MISQSYEVINYFQPADNIPATIIQMKRNNILQIKNEAIKCI